MALKDAIGDITGAHFGLGKKKELGHMLGRQLWDYKILGEIYTGSVSTVCRALAPDDRLVAMKFLKVDQANVREARKKFQREAQLTAQWNHERLISVLDYYPEVHQPAMILEYFDDRNMKFRILHKHEVIRAHTLRIMQQCLEGLQYIHDNGYVHLDIKPENILINDEGEARVIDFTITERIGRFHLGVRKIQGSRSYIAPETIRRRPPTPQTDIYSLGCSFYETLSARPPFRAEQPNQLLTKHLREQPSGIRNFVQHINPKLDELVMKMLAKKPADRPADCGAALDLLSKIDRPFVK